MILGILSVGIGILYANKSKWREKDLEEIKYALELFKTKIQYTYEPIPEVFQEIAKECRPHIGNIFVVTCQYLSDQIASEAWKHAIIETSSKTNLLREDQEILFQLSKMLGNMDLEGQLSIIELTITLLEQQIEKVKRDGEKNEKLYKTLGVGIGLTMMIILI